MNSFFKLFLSFALIFRISILCDDSLHLICTSDKDCKSFGDKIISSTCEEAGCICRERKSGNIIKCIPRLTKIPNSIANCPCNVPNTECKEGKCVCMNGFIMSEDKTRCFTSIVQLGKSCDITQQCVQFDKNSECNKNKNVCQCMKNFVEIENNCRSEVENTCKEHTECQNHAECKEGKCICNKNFIASSNRTICLPFAQHSDNCTEEIQCEMGLGVGSECKNGRCLCEEKFSKISDGEKVICSKLIYHGDECVHHKDCVSFLDEPKMICDKGKCKCRDGYELHDAYSYKCVPSSTQSSSSSIQAYSILIIISIIFITLL